MKACAPYKCGATACKTRCDVLPDCVSGSCIKNKCCAGCWDGEVCVAGDTVKACGKGGNGCQRCPYQCLNEYNNGRCLNGGTPWALAPACRSDGVCISAPTAEGCAAGCRVSPPACTPLNGCEP